MSIPTTFAPVKSQDFVLTPLRVYKRFVKNQNDLITTGSGYNLTQGWHSNRITPVDAPQSFNDPVNPDGTFKHIVWNSIDHLYYRSPYNPFETFEHHNARYTHKFLNVSASILSIPYMDHGEQIKPGSVRIYNSDTGIELVDDSNGNLYDPVLEDRISAFPRYSVAGYWGFNSEFRRFKTHTGHVDSGVYHYDSRTFSPHKYPSTVHNVSYQVGPTISGSACGMAAVFQSGDRDYGFIRTPHQDHLNYDSLDEFTISFWFKPHTQNQTTGSIISKNGVVFENTFGPQAKVLASSGVLTQAIHISSSYQDHVINVYPYDFKWHDDTIIFTRTDGSRTITITGSATEDVWNHVVLTRYTDTGVKKIRMYVNGTSSLALADPTSNPINKHAIMFGSRTMNGTDAYSGSLDEIRFIDRAFYSGSVLDTPFYESLYDLDFMYNTAVVGNVFYRGGKIVVSPILNKYQSIFTGNYEFEFKSTHTIYQYEVLCRIRKGDFNLTLNPTALQSPKSDLLINDMTGSLLQPYATTIGLYNQRGDLVAVGKMGQPLQMRQDVDLNVLVRWDA